MGLAVSLQHQDAGSSPRPAQWVESGSQLQLVSDPWAWELHVPWGLYLAEKTFQIPKIETKSKVKSQTLAEEGIF